MPPIRWLPRMAEAHASIGFIAAALSAFAAFLKYAFLFSGSDTPNA